MSEAQLFYTGLAISLLISLLVVVYLRKPLFRLLVDLCHTEDRARFWVQITTLTFLMAAMFMALTYHPHNTPATHYYLVSIFSRTLFGLLGVTGFLTFVISIFARRADIMRIKSGKSA